VGKLFTAASTEFMNYPGGLVTAMPLTMGCWFSPTSLAATQTLMDQHNAASAPTRSSYSISVTSTGAITAVLAGSASTGTAQSTTTIAVDGLWHHAVGVFTSSSLRAAFLDGGGKGTNTTLEATSTINVFNIGRLAGNSFTQYASSRIAEAAIWKASLTDAEVRQLAQGVLPVFIRPQSLVGYWSLRLPGALLEPDLTPWSPRRYDLAVTGTTLADHPQMLTSGLFPGVARRRRAFGATPTGGVTVGTSVLRSGILQSRIIQAGGVA
jgi:hypothetical protein